VEIREYWRIVRRRWWIPTLMVVAAVVVVGLLNMSSPAKYVATATAVARTATDTDKAIRFEEIGTSTKVALRVRDRLHLSESAQDILRRTTVTGNSISALYRVSVTDGSPDRAVAIANALSEEAAAVYTDLAAGSQAVRTIQVDAQRAAYRERYLAATQRVLDYGVLHPDALGAASALPGDVQGTSGVGEGGGGLQALPVYLAPTDSDVEAKFLALRLAEQLASEAYRDFEAESARVELNELKAARAQVVDPAVAEKDTTARQRLFYAATLALVLGVGIAVGWDHFQHTVRLPEEAEILAGHPVIGIIPRANTRVVSAARAVHGG